MKQITEDYVSYEIAVLLKEKGFDECVYTCYTVDDYPLFMTMIDYVVQDEIYEHIENDCHIIQAPTHQMALKWLREVHKICITIDGYPTIDGNFEFKPRIFNSTGKYWEDWHLSYKTWFTSYEETCEAAILYVLKNLI